MVYRYARNVMEELLTENKIKPENADEYTAFHHEHVVQRSFSVITKHSYCKLLDIPMYIFLKVFLQVIFLYSLSVTPQPQQS